MSAVTVQVEQQTSTAIKGAARQHTVMIDRPVAKEGTDEGAMGGELLLMSLGGCFMSNLLAAIRAREATVSGVNISIVGTLESAPPRFSAVEMQISADYEDRALMEKLVTIAERGCIVANTLKKSVDLSLTIQ